MANFHTRLKHALERAQQGSVEDQYFIGSTLCFGGFIPKDEKSGQKWLQKAATAKHAKSCLLLGMLYIKSNIDLAKTWLRQAVDLNDRDAPYILWTLNMEQVDLWKLSVERGSPLSLCDKALFIESSILIKSNQEKLIEMVKMNNAVALYRLSLTEESTPLKLDMQRTCARAGVFDAMFEMSQTEPEHRERWLKAAYQSGSSAAAFQIVRFILEHHEEREHIEYALLILNRLESHIDSVQLAECHYLKGRAYSLRFLKTKMDTDRLSALTETFKSYQMGHKLGTDLLSRLAPELMKYNHEKSFHEGLRSKRFVAIYMVVFLAAIVRLSFIAVEFVEKGVTPRFSMLEMILYPSLAFIGLLALGAKRPALLDKISPTIKTLHKQAQNGDKHACLSLSQKYKLGDGVEKDTATSALYLKKAAVSGLAKAQYLYAKYLEDNSPDNRLEVLKWYEKSAESGNKEAQYSLGATLIHDVNKKQVAVKLMKRAHGQGSIKATRWLAWYYLNGKYHKPNPLKAIEYLGIALSHSPLHEAELQYGMACARMLTDDQTGRIEHHLWQAARLMHGGALNQLHRNLTKKTHVNQMIAFSAIRPYGPLAKQYFNLFDNLDSLSSHSLSLLTQKAGVDVFLQAYPSTRLRRVLQEDADNDFAETLDKVIPYRPDSKQEHFLKFDELSVGQCDARLNIIDIVKQMFHDRSLSFRNEPPHFIQTLLLSDFSINALMDLSEREMQLVLQKSDLITLSGALLGSDPFLKSTLKNNLSKRVLVDIHNRQTQSIASLASISEACQQFILIAEEMHHRKFIDLKAFRMLPQPGPKYSNLIQRILFETVERSDERFLKNIIRDTNKQLAMTALRYVYGSSVDKRKTMMSKLNRDCIDEIQMQDVENRSVTSRDALDWLMSLELNQSSKLPSMSQKGLAFSLSMTSYGAPYKSKIKLATASFDSLLNLSENVRHQIVQGLSDADAINMLGSMTNNATRQSWKACFPESRQNRLEPLLDIFGNASNWVADQMIFSLIETVLTMIDGQRCSETELERL